MFDSLVADTTHHRTGGGAVAAWARVESAASARRLAAMADLLEARRAGADSDNREQWYLDNWAAVAAEIGAAQNTTPDAAGAQLLIAHALRTRLPHVGAVFAQGLLTYATVSTIAYRTFAITDPTALAAVDAEIAAALRTWPPMSKRKLTVAIDAIVETHDPYAVRRSQVTARSRYLDVDADGNGCATLGRDRRHRRNPRPLRRTPLPGHRPVALPRRRRRRQRLRHPARSPAGHRRRRPRHPPQRPRRHHLPRRPTHQKSTPRRRRRRAPRRHRPPPLPLRNPGLHRHPTSPDTVHGRLRRRQRRHPRRHHPRRR
nr:13E12 repeat family protein [Mycolicibacterium sediminis]